MAKTAGYNLIVLARQFFLAFGPLLAAAGPIFNAAVKELTLLPKGAIEKQVAAQILIARRIEIENNPVSDTNPCPRPQPARPLKSCPCPKSSKPVKPCSGSPLPPLPPNKLAPLSLNAWLLP